MDWDLLVFVIMIWSVCLFQGRIPTFLWFSTIITKTWIKMLFRMNLLPPERLTLLSVFFYSISRQLYQWKSTCSSHHQEDYCHHNDYYYDCCVWFLACVFVCAYIVAIWTFLAFCLFIWSLILTCLAVLDELATENTLNRVRLFGKEACFAWYAVDGKNYITAVLTVVDERCA